MGKQLNPPVGTQCWHSANHLAHCSSCGDKNHLIHRTGEALGEMRCQTPRRSGTYFPQSVLSSGTESKRSLAGFPQCGLHLLCRGAARPSFLLLPGKNAHSFSWPEKPGRLPSAQFYDSSSYLCPFCHLPHLPHHAPPCRASLCS
jgi:hypothetical protein